MFTLAGTVLESAWGKGLESYPAEDTLVWQEERQGLSSGWRRLCGGGGGIGNQRPSAHLAIKRTCGVCERVDGVRKVAVFRAS